MPPVQGASLITAFDLVRHFVARDELRYPELTRVFLE